MARAAGKPKPPPYPRPVSPIHAEEIICDLGDEVSRQILPYLPYTSTGYERQEDEDPDTCAERRATKRRRIEENAQAYLRGQPLYIMSARLRGPFDNGWRNPWSQRVHNELKIGNAKSTRNKFSETTIKGRAKAYDETTEQRRSVIAAKERWLHRRSAEDEDGIEKGQAQPRETLSAAGLNNSPRNEVRVEEWLKTNNAFLDKDDTIPSQQSPTPAEPLRRGIQVLRSFGEQSSSDTSHQHNVSTIYERIQQISRNMNEVVHGPQPKYRKQLRKDRVVERDSAWDAATNKPSNNVKHRTLHTADSFHGCVAKISRTESGDAGASNHVNIIPNADEQTAVGQQIDAVRTDNINQAADPQLLPRSDPGFSEAASHLRIENELQNMLLMKPYSTAHTGRSSESDIVPVMAQSSVRREPSAATSDLNTIDLLPSAQNPPPLQPTVSSNSPVVQLIDAEPIQETTGEALDSMRQGDRDMAQVVRNPILESVTFSKSSVAGQVASKRSQLDGPVLGTKTKQDNKRKRTSFATTLPQTQKSLNRMARVKVNKSMGSPPAFSVSKDDMGFDHSDQDNNASLSNTSMSNMTITNKPSKGILKSTNPTNSQNSNKQNKNSTSISQQQDGQGDKFLEEVQKAVIDDDEFDLEAAIDDLGSFLGSWDAEKEASGLI